MTVKRVAVLLAAAGIAALAVTGATAAAASSAPSGIEHWTVESTNPITATATRIARGPVTNPATLAYPPAVSAGGGVVQPGHRGLPSK